MSKFNFSLNDIHHYDWGNLWWFEYEIQIGLWALKDLVTNQEEIYLVKKADFLKNREKRLAEIPDEYKDSYAQQFFEDGDRTFAELINIQRNSACLSFFSFLESKLIELLKMMNMEFNVQFEVPTTKVLASLKVLIEKGFGVSDDNYNGNYDRILNQVIIRNSIAHQDSFIKHEKYFPKREGIELRGLKIIISDTSYLTFLIKEAEDLFKELLIAVDKRLTQVKTKS